MSDNTTEAQDATDDDILVMKLKLARVHFERLPEVRFEILDFDMTPSIYGKRGETTYSITGTDLAVKIHNEEGWHKAIWLAARQSESRRQALIRAGAKEITCFRRDDQEAWVGRSPKQERAREPLPASVVPAETKAKPLVTDLTDALTRVGVALGLEGRFLVDFGYKQVEERAHEIMRRNLIMAESAREDDKPSPAPRYVEPRTEHKKQVYLNLRTVFRQNDFPPPMEGMQAAIIEALGSPCSFEIVKLTSFPSLAPNEMKVVRVRTLEPPGGYGGLHLEMHLML